MRGATRITSASAIEPATTSRGSRCSGAKSDGARAKTLMAARGYGIVWARPYCLAEDRQECLSQTSHDRGFALGLEFELPQVLDRLEVRRLAPQLLHV